MTTLQLTYEQLGERLGLAPHAARMRARRRHWLVTPGNDGRARVAIDDSDLAAELNATAEREVGREGEREGERAPLVADLRERLAGAERERDELRAATAEFRVELARLEERLAAAGRVEIELRASLGDARSRLDRAELRLDTPWWKRLFGA